MTRPPTAAAEPGWLGAWWLVALIPVILHFAFLARYAVNIPKWDDHALRNFLVDYNQTDSWGEKISLIFAQHNEHRIAFDRLVTLIVYQLTGEINFVWLMFIGSFSLLGILAIFYQLIRQSSLPGYFFLPLPWLLLTLQHQENTFWGMASLQNFSVVFFLIFSVFLLSKTPERAFVLGCFLAIMAVFTSGNGVLVWPMGAGLLLLQKRWKGLIYWIILAGLTSLIYFFNYQKPPGNPPTPNGDAWLYLKGFLGFIGSVADWQPEATERFVLPVLAGLLLLVGAAYFSVKSLLKTPWLRGGADVSDYFVLGVLVFVIASAAVVTVGRIGFGDWILLTSRVKIYSAVLLLTLVIAVLREIPVRRQKVGFQLVLFGAILFNGWTTFLEFGEVIFHRQDRISQLFIWKYGHRDGQQRRPMPAYDRVTFPYQAPALFYDQNGNRSEVKQGKISRFSIDSLYQNEVALTIGNRSYIKSGGPDAGAYVQLRSDSLTLLFPTRQHRNRSRRSLLSGGGYFAPGFTATIPKTDAPDGSYEVRILTTDGQTRTEYPTSWSVILRHNPSNKLPKNW
ncbi:MAG: hypothetical protein LH606_09950 [Cytophagaceae bacterium]|nr:hypothetical protein [Cytophagaceae bacterium]